MTTNHNFVFDSLLQLKDSGAATASAAAQVGGVDKVLDLGAAYMEGNLVIDWTAIDTVTGDEKYEIEWQLSPDLVFTAGTIVVPTTVKLGDSSVSGSGADTGATGRLIQGVSNEYNGTVYPYARLYTRVAGAVAVSLTYAAFLTAR